MEQNLLRQLGKAGRAPEAPNVDIASDSAIASEVTVRDVFAMLKRRRTLFLTIFCIGIVCVTTFVFLVTPKFEAKGQLLLDNRANVKNPNAVIAMPTLGIADVPNEVQILKSRVLAASVMDTLQLDRDPEFNHGFPPLPPKPATAVAAPSTKDANAEKENATAAGTADPTGPAVKDAAGVVKTVATNTETVSKNDAALVWLDPARAKLVDRFLKRLDVRSERESRVIDVSFESPNPEKAARVVNELLKTYLSNQVEYQRQTLTKASERLDIIVTKLEEEVSVAEDAVQKYRAKMRIVEGKGGTDVIAQQVAEVNSQLVRARAEQALAEASLNRMLTLMKSKDSLDAAPEVLKSSLIQRFREKEAELLRERSQLVSRYGEKHPKMIKIRSEIRELGDKIRDEINKIVEGLTSEVAIAKARTEALRDALQKLEGSAIQNNNAQIQLRELERVVEQKRQQHQTFLVRLRETRAQQEMIEPTARVVSYAEVPTSPSFPKKGKTLALASMVLALLAAVASIAAEALRRTFETTTEVERALRLRPLGAFPQLFGVEKLLERPEELFSNQRNYQLMQSIRNIRSALYLSNDSKEPNSILVTSALPGEGKTSFAMFYAAFCAANGQRVLLVDCNFNQPTVHEVFDMPNEIGMTDVLANEEKLREAIRTLPNTGFDYISSGRIATGKPELLDAAAMQRFMESVAWDYDVVIIDSSPVLSMANAHVLAKLVDSTIFVVRWRHTRREMAAEAVKRLRSVGVTSLGGFLLSSVNPRKFEGPEDLFDPFSREEEGGPAGLVQRSLRRFRAGGNVSRAA